MDFPSVTARLKPPDFQSYQPGGDSLPLLPAEYPKSVAPHSLVQVSSPGAQCSQVIDRGNEMPDLHARAYLRAILLGARADEGGVGR